MVWQKTSDSEINERSITKPSKYFTMVKFEAHLISRQIAGLSPHYMLLGDLEIIWAQIETIHEFVSNLLESMQDLEPRHSKLVDEYLYELA